VSGAPGLSHGGGGDQADNQIVEADAVAVDAAHRVVVAKGVEVQPIAREGVVRRVVGALHVAGRKGEGGGGGERRKRHAEPVQVEIGGLGVGEGVRVGHGTHREEEVGRGHSGVAEAGDGEWVEGGVGEGGVEFLGGE